MGNKTALSTSDLSGIDCYKLMTGLIIPRPIGWIGTVGENGVSNLAPYSFFQGVAVNPPTVMFSTSVSDLKLKDSVINARWSGVFTASIVDHDLSVAMNDTAAEVAADVDEFDLAGVTAKWFGGVDAPAVAEAKAVLECKVSFEHTIGDEAMQNIVMFGEVVAFHIDDAILDGTRIDAAKLDAVGRLAGMSYATTRDMFRLERPT